MCAQCLVGEGSGGLVGMVGMVGMVKNGRER